MENIGGLESWPFEAGSMRHVGEKLDCGLRQEICHEVEGVPCRLLSGSETGILYQLCPYIGYGHKSVCWNSGAQVMHIWDGILDYLI